MLLELVLQLSCSSPIKPSIVRLWSKTAWCDMPQRRRSSISNGCPRSPWSATATALKVHQAKCVAFRCRATALSSLRVQLKLATRFLTPPRTDNYLCPDYARIFTHPHNLSEPKKG
jgi:hypothetical protein